MGVNGGCAFRGDGVGVCLLEELEELCCGVVLDNEWKASDRSGHKVFLDL